MGPVTPKHQGKPASTRYQKTRPANKIQNRAESAKPPSPVQIRAAPPTILSKIARRVNRSRSRCNRFGLNCNRCVQPSAATCGAGVATCAASMRKCFFAGFSSGVCTGGATSVAHVTGLSLTSAIDCASASTAAADIATGVGFVAAAVRPALTFGTRIKIYSFEDSSVTTGSARLAVAFSHSACRDRGRLPRAEAPG